ncbi:MAG TPA: hypothetical protein DCW68_06955 [Rhodospirillaceae bacterium]|nr:hypothetical protein [Rhodospirillaceae bacterium]
MTSKSPAERLRQARTARYKTARQFAEIHDIPQPTYTTHETGTRSITKKMAEKYGHLLGVSPQWILFGEGAPPTPKPQHNSSAVIEYDVQASAGGGAFVDHEHAIGEWCFPQRYLHNITNSPKAALSVISMVGDSMEPTLHPGCKLLIDHQQRIPTPPGLFVLWDGMGTVCKRLHFAHDRKGKPISLVVKSDNPAYPPYECDLGEVSIVGRVIAAINQV